jgi:hypothetical protein
VLRATEEAQKSSKKMSWRPVSDVLERSEHDCRDMWISIQARSMKRGPWTAEEGALVFQRVREWGDRGNGLWTSLSQEMGRSAKSVRGYHEKESIRQKKAS